LITIIKYQRFLIGCETFFHDTGLNISSRCTHVQDLNHI